MGYIYEGMDRVKEAIRAIYFGNHVQYRPIWEVIDRRWHNLLDRLIHATAYYLNSGFQFRPDFKANDEVLSGLYEVVERMSPDLLVGAHIVREVEMFRNAQGDFFSRDICKQNRTQMMSDVWWEMFGNKVPNLQKIAIRILSQPCSASRCERNWSMFEHIHSKKRNRLAIEKLNDFVFVHYNLRLHHKQILGTDTSPITLEEVDPEGECNTELDNPVFNDEDLD
ncbi:uncharacterized protein LOC131079198 [Cryptomeria japonica]|uniref:uncharacterized protein LOC131079198 n=1 Tax=Cryptomeria japonica TaxID=3369 RepID=UPI0027D9D131|nr:uncharacterized protein LOC131079198 [Cryptomeria japonica]